MKTRICDICRKEGKISQAIVKVTFKRGFADGSIRKITIDFCLNHKNWHKDKKYDDVIKFLAE